MRSSVLFIFVLSGLAILILSACDQSRECDCFEEVPVPSSSEVIIGSDSLSLEHLLCRVNVVNLYDTTAGENKYRTVIAHSSGKYYDLAALQKRDRQVGSNLEKAKQQVLIRQLPPEFKKDVILWRRDQDPELIREATTEQIRSFAADPAVGRMVFPPRKELKLYNQAVSDPYCTYCDYYPFHMSALQEAANYGEGMRVGIQESKAFNTDEADECFDEKVKIPVASLQRGTPGWGEFFGSCHHNLVASRMWGSGSGLLGSIYRSDPVAIGIGGNTDLVSLFDIYSEVLPFLISNQAYIVNYSAYFSRDYDQEECNTEPSYNFELLQDYYQYKYGLLIVQAVGNLCNSAMCLRLTNALTVGGSRPAFSQVTNGAFHPGLEIPHVVGVCHYQGEDCDNKGEPGGLAVLLKGGLACSTGNSFNAPGVTSIATLLRSRLLQLGEKHPVRPELLKSIIVASADYGAYFAGDPGGPDADPRCAGCPADEAYPEIDCYFGGGEADGDRALAVVERGDYRTFEVHADTWSHIFDEFAVHGDNGSVQAALAWSNAVTCDAGDCYFDGTVTHDFDLFLEQWKDGQWTPILKSQRRGGTYQWMRADLSRLVDAPQNNRFRFVTYQVSRRVDRKTYLGFAYYLENSENLVEIPPADPTPPSVEMKVRLGSSEYILTPESEDLHFNLSRSGNTVIEITVTVTDTDGGVQEACLWYGYELQCQSGDFGQIIQPNIPSTCDQDEGAGTGYAHARRTYSQTFYKFDFMDGCREGWDFSDVMVEFQGAGSNFFQTLETARFSFEID